MCGGLQRFHTEFKYVEAYLLKPGMLKLYDVTRLTQRSFSETIFHDFPRLVLATARCERKVVGSRGKSMLRTDNLIKVLLGPTYQHLDSRDERLTSLSQPIFYSWRHLGVDLAVHEVACLKLLQRLRKHLLRAISHMIAYLTKTHWALVAVVKGVEHEHGPFVAKSTDDLANGACEIFGIDFFL